MDRGPQAVLQDDCEEREQMLRLREALYAAELGLAGGKPVVTQEELDQQIAERLSSVI